MDKKTADLLEEICKNGLPKPRYYPIGLDGHRYDVRIEGSAKEYSCWGVLPKKWKPLGEIIDRSVAYAQLDPSCFGVSGYQ